MTESATSAATPTSAQPPSGLLLVTLALAAAACISAVGTAAFGRPGASARLVLTASAAGIPPKPDAATAAAYVADLKAIDLDIVGKKDPEIIVDRGRNACASAKNHPGDEAAAVEGVRKRFTSPSHTDGLAGDVPARIWAVVHARLCPAY